MLNGLNHNYNMKNNKYKVFVVNPGSTSTKIALFEGDTKMFQLDVDHDIEELNKCENIQAQLPIRMNTILDAIEKNNLDMEGIDAFATRAGGLVGLKGGVYNIEENNVLFETTSHSNRHPNVLGPQIVVALSKKYGGKCFTVNPPDVDELCDYERLTGFYDVFRESRGHPLNQKENAIRYANSIGKSYENLNIIVCHLGGGVTVGAHRNGKLIACNDCLSGDGPMAPTRSGWVPSTDVVKMCFSGQYTEKEILERISKTGGFSDHLHTNDAREIHKMIDEGNEYAKLVYDGFIYQVAKQVGSCACALKGKVDAIILTGGMSKDVYLRDTLVEYISWIAPVINQCGEFEMEALSSGSIRVLSGQEKALEYTGIPVFSGFKCKGAPELKDYKG